ncbi:PHP domain-containing protein [Desulfobacterales bacterium HSG2]|nr:PHP domain-containing protein [Desulfobacterales bacterium HSG2]
MDKQVKIDLHIHSDASDGTLSPSEILDLALNLKLGAIALTDHDTVEGSKKIIDIGIPPSIRFLTGIEISAIPPPSFPCSGSFHILGYGLRPDDPVLNQTLDVLQKARRDRNPRVIERLNSLGIDLSATELADIFGEGQIGRPHIARIMLKKGYVRSIDEAFDRYLSRGKAAYVDKYRVDCGKAIEIIAGAGGVPVLAHPGLLKPADDTPLENLIRTLKTMGLKGIEVCYPEHSDEQTALYSELAGCYDLLITGGTDFHGSLKPDIQMGSGRGDFFVPYALYEKLKLEIGN